jgi:hypothetical protein
MWKSTKEGQDDKSEHGRKLSDEDLDKFSVLLDTVIIKKLEQLENDIMATLADILADEQAEGGEITQLVDAFNAQTATIADLQAQIAALAPGTLTADQQASIDATFAAAEANKAALTAAIPVVVTPPPPPPVFVAKVDGEAYTDYTARVDAWNADPANAANPVTAVDEATWTALPVG